MPSKKQNEISRREFAALATTGAAGLAAASSLGLAADVGTKAAALPPLDIAEWSFFWVGVERMDLGKGPVVNGKQMYVEYQVPAKVRHPYPIVLVHGGGGQGLDWMGTPDGRRGWSTHLLLEGRHVFRIGVEPVATLVRLKFRRLLKNVRHVGRKSWPQCRV